MLMVGNMSTGMRARDTPPSTATISAITTIRYGVRIAKRDMSLLRHGHCGEFRANFLAGPQAGAVRCHNHLAFMQAGKNLDVRGVLQSGHNILDCDVVVRR